MWLELAIELITVTLGCLLIFIFYTASCRELYLCIHISRDGEKISLLDLLRNECICPYTDTIRSNSLFFNIFSALS